MTRSTIDEIWSEPESTTFDYLRTTCGFSSDIIERFFRPWFSGVFFERELSTSSRFFKFIFRMFAIGDVALPAEGMGAIPRQLARDLPAEMCRLSSRVASLDGLTVRLESGETLQSSAIILAVEGPEASRLTGTPFVSQDPRSTTCFYYAAPTPPITESLLILNGDPSGPINNLCVPSNVAPSFAPPGQSLVSISVIGQKASATTQLELDVRTQLREWYGSQVDRWLTLPSYYIPHALPGQPVHFRDQPHRSSKLAEGLYHCGDYCETASIHGAMISGRYAAESVLADLKIPAA